VLWCTIRVGLLFSRSSGLENVTTYRGRQPRPIPWKPPYSQRSSATLIPNCFHPRLSFCFSRSSAASGTENPVSKKTRSILGRTGRGQDRSLTLARFAAPINATSLGKKGALHKGSVRLSSYVTGKIMDPNLVLALLSISKLHSPLCNAK